MTPARQFNCNVLRVDLREMINRSIVVFKLNSDVAFNGSFAFVRNSDRRLDSDHDSQFTSCRLRQTICRACFTFALLRRAIQACIMTVNDSEIIKLNYGTHFRTHSVTNFGTLTNVPQLLIPATPGMRGVGIALWRDRRVCVVCVYIYV